MGSILARQAINLGLEVCALTRNTVTATALRKMGVSQVVEAELDSPDWHSKLSPVQDCVVNCVGSAGGGLDGYRKSYIEGQKSILRWARKGRVGTYLFTSSIAVYPQSNNVEVDETNSTEGASKRGQILLEAEQLLVEGQFPGSRWFILRLAGIYGPGRHSLLDRLREPSTYITGADRHLNLIHRDDVCSAIWAALKAPNTIENEIFNVCDDNPQTKKKVMRWLADTLGCPLPEFKSGKSAGGDEPQGMSPRNLDRRINNRKIKSKLGWHPAFPTCQDGYRQILQTA